jgi:phosphate transport system substrate-binding protein
MELIGLKGQSDVANVVVATGTAAVMQEVAGNSYAIAYDSLGYVTSDVKKLNVDGAEATIANIKSGTYAISRPLSVVYKTATVAASPLLTSYLDFLKSSDAQTLISNNGYVSIIDAATAYTANGSLQGTIEVSGSTSLQPLMILLAAQYEAAQAHVSVEVSGGGTGTGYTNAENGVSSFGMISAAFDSTKAPDCVASIVAKDGIAVIVNPANPLTSISKTELKNLYDNTESDATKIKTWSQLVSA